MAEEKLISLGKDGALFTQTQFDVYSHLAEQYLFNLEQVKGRDPRLLTLLKQFDMPDAVTTENQQPKQTPPNPLLDEANATIIADPMSSISHRQHVLACLQKLRESALENGQTANRRSPEQTRKFDNIFPIKQEEV